MAFATRCNHKTSADLPSPCGERIVTKYKRKVTDDGCLRLVEDGTEDIYTPIQAAADPGGIYAIIDAYVRTGDASVLEQQRGVYADVSSAPRTLAELEQLRIDSRERFFALPLDVRQLYHNNPEEFIANSGRALAALEAASKSHSGAGKTSAAAESGSKGATAGAADNGNNGGDN